MAKIIRTVEVIAKTSDAIKEVEKLNKELDQTSKEAKEAGKDIDKMNKETSASANKVSANMKKIGTAIKASGIALLVGIALKLGQRFSQSADGIRLATTAMEGMNIALDTTIQFYRDMFLAWGYIFEGDFSKGWDKTKEAVNGASDSFKDLYGNAKKLADLKIFSTEFARGAQITAALIESEIIAQKQISENTDLSFAKRIEATKQLNAEQSKLISLREQAIENDIKYFEAKDSLTEAEKDQLASLRASYILVGNTIEEQRIENLNRMRSLQAEIKEKDPREIVNPVTGLSTNELDTVMESQFKAIEISNKNQMVSAKAVQKAKNALALEGAEFIANSLANVADEGSVLQKAAGVASVLIDTYKGIMSVWGAYGAVPYVAAAMTAVIAAIGQLNIQKILATKKPSEKNLSGNVSRTSGNVSQPNFNVVESSNTNQLNETLAANNIEPVKAYVVSSEMTTQQALDRQITNTATIG